MPTYVYEYLNKQGRPTGETFETFQRMKDDALTQHPETGRPCRRAVVAPNVITNELHGTRQRSREIKAKPHEVAKLQKLYGDSGRCWQPDGTVKFQDKTDASKFFAKDEALRERFAEQKAAGKLKTKAEKRAARAAKMAKVVRNG